MHPLFRNAAVAQMTGTGGLQRVPRGYVENFQIPLPPLAVQQEIVAEIEGYQKEITRLESEILANRQRIQATINKVWDADAESAKGAPPYQPGATPQVPDPKPIQG